MKEASRTEVIDAMLERADKNLAMLSRVSSPRTQIAMWSKQIIESNSDMTFERALRIYENLKRVPFVDKLVVRGASITMYTKPIYVGKLLFGSWKASLGWPCRIFNISKDGSISYNIHATYCMDPDTGRYCFGGWKPGMKFAVYTSNYAMAAVFIKNLLTNSTRNGPTYDLLRKLNGPGFFAKKYPNHPDISRRHFTILNGEISIYESGSHLNIADQFNL